MKVLLVEDEVGIARFVVRGLRWHGFDVEHVGTGAAALDRSHDADVVVLDLGLPDVDGFEVLRRVRGRGEDVPVLVLTARDALEDRVEGLEVGADDYLTKPFAFDELVARLRALLRRASDGSTDTVGHAAPVAAGDAEAGRALVIEAEPRIADVLVRGLAPLGVEVTVAQDGAVGSRLAASGLFDVVLVDVGVPGASGLDLVRALRASAGDADVIVLAARDDPSARAAGLAAGAVEYVTKPFVLESLRERVRGLLAADRRARRARGRLSASSRPAPPD